MTFLFDHDVPDDLAYTLTAMGHEVRKLRELLDVQITADALLRYAGENDLVLITCNRDDFLTAAQTIPHAGIIIRYHHNDSSQLADARTCRLVSASRGAGDSGIRNNINFA